MVMVIVMVMTLNHHRRSRTAALCYRPMRVLGLDVGSKTIGVAVSDETGLVASPHETLARRGTTADVGALAALAERFGAHQIVVGLPLEMDGTPGPRARRV